MRTPGASNGLTLPLVAFLGATLLVRVLTDDRSAPDSRHSGSLNLSGAIAVVFIVIAGALLLSRRRGFRATVLASLWLCVWTAVAVGTRGASAETLREGVREGSVVALAVIVYNARGAVSVPTAARLVQFIGFAAAVLALYQLATDTGMNISGNIRSNGTFAHPNSASMFFAIAAATSLWLYLSSGRHRADALLMVLFAAALITTFSIDGLAALVAMLLALGALQPGPLRAKLGPWLTAGLVVLAFVATPLGGHRIARASATGAEASGTSLDWRFHKWKLLLPEWERSPVFGRGLGTTITEAGTVGNPFAGEPPHNEYVRYLVETGVVGLAILLCGVALLIRLILARKRSSHQHGEKALGDQSLALVIVLGCLVNSLADNTFLDSPTCYAAALIVVASLSLPTVRQRRVSAA